MGHPPSLGFLLPLRCHGSAPFSTALLSCSPCRTASPAQDESHTQQEAHLIAVACTPAPTGQPHWTLQLLADQAVELGFVDSIARETVRQILKKTPSSPGSISSGVCRRGAGSLWRPWKKCRTCIPRPMI